MIIKKRFNYLGIELQIVERRVPYLNSTITAREVIAPNGGTLPYTVGHRETLKNIVKQVTKLLDDYAADGEDVVRELTS